VCGIAGLLDVRPSAPDPWAAAAAMAGAITHRGPDDAGTWAEGPVALGFRRLAIIDLTEAGHQPMTSASGRWVLVFNGEVYNHAELRRDLLAAGVRFRSTSDTEVLLEAIDRWGVEPTLARVNGMFAFGLWDRERRVLVLARDRLGEKPLYYGWIGDAVVFASELQALRAHPDAGWDVDRDSLAAYLRLGYVPAPDSIYLGVRKLPPGCYLELRADSPRSPSTTAYWRAFDAAVAGQRDPLDVSPAEAVDAVVDLLEDSVRLRMVADVPVGAFLSGGIDSSLVVALMQRLHDRPVRTFSIGFDDPRWNEADHAARVAAHLGTDHTEQQLTSSECIDVVPSLGAIADEPLGDASLLPTVLVSRLARADVTVTLSGDGGDELFAGYDRYAAAASLWTRLARVPMPARRAAARLLHRTPTAALDRLGGALPSRYRTARLGDRLHKLGRSLPATSAADGYLRLSSHWPDPDAVVLGGHERSTPFTDPAHLLPGADAMAQAMYVDTVAYLPDDILAKVDRATMSTSLEGRIPLLDHRLVELAWRLPASVKRVDGTGKWVLREALARHVPQSLFERPKMGFGVPVGDWIRGPLRPWAEDLLAERRLREDGFLDVATVRSAWMDHLHGRNATDRIWDVLVFQAWLDVERSR
jgi:asparagine synthase (glutamine-hydrolysing)